MKNKVDMTTGPILRKALIFALPIIVGNILQQLYTTVDTLVIGNYCGSTSLAAVGTSSQPVEVLVSLFLGVGSGVSILVSQAIGAKKRERINGLLKTAITFVFMCGIPLGIIGYLCTPFILRVMGVPEDTWSYAMAYTQIVFLGTLGNLGYNMNAGVLNGMGDSGASMLFLVASCISNIVLDLVFVAGMGMDVSGAALSTSIAMYISWAISIIYIKKKYPELNYTVLPRGLDKDILKHILSIGLPIGLNNSLYSFGHMAIQTLVNAQGSTFMAGASVAGRVTGISNIAITGLSSAATTFSGQNYGAENYKRLKKGHLLIPFVSGAITLSFGLMVIGLRMPILRFFTRDEAVLVYASRYVVVMLLSQWIYAVFNAIHNIVNGTGHVRYTTTVNLMMLWVVRIPVAYLIDHFFDGTYLMLCFPISFAFGMFAMLGYYIFAPAWKDIMKKADAEELSECS